MVDKECVNKEGKDISCSKCGSKFTYIRLKEKSRVCRSCGNIDLIVEDKE